MNKVAIPQADEQQRLLANLILSMNLPKKPLPRFWYFPRGAKSVVVMTGDDHGNGNTVTRFNSYLATSAPGCSVEEWECVRASAYLFPGAITKQQASEFESEGFEVGVHVNSDCQDWQFDKSQQSEPERQRKTNKGAVHRIYSSQLSAFREAFPDQPPPATSRTHCISWGDYDTQPQVEFDLGIRLDANYYYWPSKWVQDRPGLFTGSGMPMRFAKADGTLLDIYQAATQMTDESGQAYPLHSDALIANALGPSGYYGAFTANMHNDTTESPQAGAIVASAQAHGVPVVTARQMLAWLDGRNGSWFNDVMWTNGKLSFSVSVAAGAHGIEVMVPAASSAGSVSRIERNGVAIAYTTEEIKGIEYVVVAGHTGHFVIHYVPDATPRKKPAVLITEQKNKPLDDVPATKLPGAETPSPHDAAPPSWSSSKWAPAGYVKNEGGLVHLEAARLASDTAFQPGATVEFEATFGRKPFEHVGFAGDPSIVEPWILLSTGAYGDGLYARIAGVQDFAIPGNLIGSSHRFRIDWKSDSVVFSVDGKPVMTRKCVMPEKLFLVASDYKMGGGKLSVRWLRVSR
jgi:hypothetical protein